MQNEAKGTKVIGAKSLEEMTANLKKPRRVMLLVKAGPAVDGFIEKLVSIRRIFIPCHKIVMGISYTSICLIFVSGQ